MEIMSKYKVIVNIMKLQHTAQLVAHVQKKKKSMAEIYSIKAANINRCRLEK